MARPEKLTVREKVTLVLVIFLIKVIQPWEYDHQYNAFWDDLKRAVSDQLFPEAKKP